MKLSNLVCIASIIALTGCASKYSTTYNSLPQGATVVCNNSIMGVTPLTLYGPEALQEKVSEAVRSIPPEARKNAPPVCFAHWASGVVAPYDTVFDHKDYPSGISLMVDYPGDTKHRAIDEARAMQIQTMQFQQQHVQQQVQQQPTPIYQPQSLPTIPTTSFPSAPGRTTTICRTLSSGTVICK